MKLGFCGFADSSHLVAVINSTLGIFNCHRLTQRKENTLENVGKLGWISAIKLQTRKINDREIIESWGIRILKNSLKIGWQHSSGWKAPLEIVRVSQSHVPRVSILPRTETPHLSGQPAPVFDNTVRKPKQNNSNKM